jgi:hypothetical protein
MKTKNIDQSIGYVQAINDVIKIIGEMTGSNPAKRNIDSVELIDKMLIGQQKLSMEEGEYYTMDKIDPKKPFKAIAGEDALFLNPIYERNNTK